MHLSIQTPHKCRIDKNLDSTNEKSHEQGTCQVVLLEFVTLLRAIGEVLVEIGAQGEKDDVSDGEPERAVEIRSILYIFLLIDIEICIHYFCDDCIMLYFFDLNEFGNICRLNCGNFIFSSFGFDFLFFGCWLGLLFETVSILQKVLPPEYECPKKSVSKHLATNLESISIVSTLDVKYSGQKQQQRQERKLGL